MPTPNDPNQGQSLTPEGLANQLFDIGAQNIHDPREVGRRVVGFLTESLFYALTSTKNDPVVFLTETLIIMVSSSAAGNETARKELLKHVGDTITNAPPFTVNKPAGPVGPAGPAGSKP